MIKPKLAFMVAPEMSKAFTEMEKNSNEPTLTKYLLKANKRLEEISKRCNTTVK